MNRVNSYTTIHLQLNQIDVLEVVILLMTYLIKYIFQTKQKIQIQEKNSRKKIIYAKKGIILYYIWNPATINRKNGKCLASISDNSVITCDEIIFAVEKSTISKNIICEKIFLYISLVFLLITITLLIAFSIYFCLIRYKAKQKHLWPYYVTNKKLINVL